MDFQIIWGELAVDDFRSLTIAIAAQNPSAAARIGNAILEKVDLLRSFPLRGSVYPRDLRGVIREILVKKYRIFYRVSEELQRVEILSM